MKKIFKILSFNKTFENYWWSRTIKVITYSGMVVIFGFALFFFINNFYDLSTRGCAQFIEVPYVNSEITTGVYTQPSKEKSMFDFHRVRPDGEPITSTKPMKICEEYKTYINWVIFSQNIAFVIFAPILWFLLLRFVIYKFLIYIILGNKK